MPKKLDSEYVYEFYKKEGYTLNSIYKNNHTIMNTICSQGHLYLSMFKDFRKGVRCRKCYDIKTSIRQKYDIEYKIKFLEKFNYTLIKELKNEYILLKCNNNHIIRMLWGNLQQGYRCKQCYLENYNGSNHHAWNPYKDVNKKLRKYVPHKWVINNMKDDPNYSDYINNYKIYSVDHIFPIKSFSDYIVENNLTDNEQFILNLRNNLINKKENLRLITKIENSSKRAKYDKKLFLEKYEDILIEILENLKKSL